MSSKKPRVLIHAGMHKTATTSLQFSLYKEKERLKEEGFFYPDIGQIHHNSILNLRLPSWQPGPVLEQLMHAEQQGIPQVIFSAEVVSILSLAEIELLSDCLDGYEVRILLVFRHWCEYLPSRWAQNCRVRDAQSFPQYIERLKTAPMDHFDLHYDEVLQRFDQVFPGQVQAISYSNIRQQNESVLGKMYSVLGLSEGMRLFLLEKDVRRQKRSNWIATEQTRI